MGQLKRLTLVFQNTGLLLCLFNYIRLGVLSLSSRKKSDVSVLRISFYISYVRVLVGLRLVVVAMASPGITQFRIDFNIVTMPLPKLFQL